MNAFIFLLVTALVDTALGLSVFATNPHRAQNRQLMLFAISMAIWTAFIMSIISASEVAGAAFLIQASSLFAVVIPGTFYMLCLAVDNPRDSIPRLLRKSVWVWGPGLVVGVLCFSPWFLQDVIMPSPGDDSLFPEARYGFWFLPYAGYFFISFLFVLTRYAIRMQQKQGLAKTEFQFILLGMSTTLLITLSLNLVMPVLTGSSQTQVYGPVGFMVMNLILAYGMATHRIMDVANLLRKTTAYALLTLYLVGVYALVFRGLEFLPLEQVTGELPLSHVIATLAVAFSMVPASGRMQRVSRLLFVNWPSTDLAQVARRANEALRSITTLREVVRRFAEIVGSSLGAESVVILLRDGDGFAQVYPEPEGGGALSLKETDPLQDYLLRGRSPLIRELLSRSRPTEIRERVQEQMKSLEAEAAAGLYTKHEMVGVMLLGARRAGRIYGGPEQQVIEVLTDQFAVTLENARLYTQVQDRKIFNDILVDNLTSGVIAVTEAGTVTVFNREAGRMADREASTTLGRHYLELPNPLQGAFDELLKGETERWERETSIRNGENGSIPIWLSGAKFRGHSGAFLGALLVFNDLSDIRQLEQQVRRTDRLASLGTLSAGMAHEIKNPLVTVKTFTELLPQRFEDEDFRTTFSSLVGQEISRIDRIVNQLLNFARPATPDLRRIEMEDLLTRAYTLVEQQLVRADIRYEQESATAPGSVMGDASLLEQVLVNLFLNAMEAMEAGGRLTVRLDNHPTAAWEMRATGGERHHADVVHVSVQDTGNGILPEDLPHVFDPFFTTKDSGTGMGLAVAHNIIQEHGGLLDVESRLGIGTTFHIVLPRTHVREGAAA